MKLLALDTAMAACSVAVIDTGHELPLAAHWLAMERGHAEALAPMAERAMRDAGLAFSDLDRIAVTTGPGTFTGVRIGLAMARGLGLALGVPVIGIDTLAAIAANERPSDASILVAADARKGEAYCALYDNEGRNLEAPAIVAAAAPASHVPPCTIVIGTAADTIIAASGRSDLQRSKAGDMPVAARFGWRAVPLPESRAMPAPLYLRAPDAKPQAASLRSPSQISVRTLSSADADMLAALHGECFDNAWPAEDFRQLLAMPGTAATAAIDHGEPIAFALFRRAADEIEVITIGTRPFAQRRGAARALLAHQFTEHPERGIASAFIEVARSNAAAQALYASCGFEAVGTRRGYYEHKGGTREDAIVMRKVLAP